MKRFEWMVCAALAVGVGLAGPLAVAEEGVTAGFDLHQRIEVSELESVTGKEGFRDLVNVQSIQNMEAVATGASFTADTIVSGNITIEANAMDRISGITLMNLMTGHANAVSTGVSISIYAPQ
ncbi:MAG: hypothetical protein LPK20_18320 [Halomonas sp.]|jgi:hypothetical protein|uniref:Uncharacterized protein n=1 Tax=Billgrantia tianxiuensis TaxID=2497861 RepID=A0A6I6SME7_9GAMM|nr:MULTISPECIES: hypothetical protein [Halomonas]MCE8035216.1 hypothetical protein [Halomonas sp. MCCC 1A11057]MDX5435513.1 hypothetical protein [Halomonas sp.]QHC51968.1 hypothetical protein EKK97_23410 [Halomonas tianxiuensis]